VVHRLIDWSLDNRFVVLLLAGIVMVSGMFSAMTLPLDAVPDLTNVQVQILTNSPALGPVEVEQFITFPVETAMSGLPRIEEIRSISRFGLSAVTVVFEEGTDIYWARNLVSERLQRARQSIPPGMGEPELGPIATGMSEIYQFEVRSRPGYDYSLMDLRTILDWQIAFQLRSVPGVIEVNTFGGELKTYEVQVDPLRLQHYNLSLQQVFEALHRNNANAGGGYIVHGQELRLIRGEGLVESLEDIGKIVIDTRAGGTPIHVHDIAEVRFAPMLRQGAVTRDGEREAVTGMVMMLMGENSRSVVANVKSRMEELAQSLPEGVYIDAFYDRTELVDKTIHTVLENIGSGAILVVAMLLILVGNLRSGLIVAAAIPLSAMFAMIAMSWGGVSANLMSLGAIDFGIIVDGAVVMVENAMRRSSQWLRIHGEQRVPLEVFRSSSHEVGKPILFAGMIVIIVFLPILSLQGMEGKMFRPMAFTFMAALLGALLLSVTVMPVMCSLLLTRGIKEKETWFVRFVKRGYAPVLTWSMRRQRTVFLVAVSCFLVSMLLASRFGAEFVPRLDEGDLAIQVSRLPSVSLEASLEMTRAIERALKQFPEVETVVSKTGRPEIANDPMGIHQTDVIVRLVPDALGPRFCNKRRTRYRHGNCSGSVRTRKRL
jgi:heavy metal efflux system protein